MGELSGDYFITTAGDTSTTTDTLAYGTSSGTLWVGNGDDWIHYDEWANYPEEKRKEDKMRGIFTVYVVDPRKQGKVLAKIEDIIATDGEQATLKANVGAVADKFRLDIEQVDISAVCVSGAFIRERKETQRVKIVKEED